MLVVEVPDDVIISAASVVQSPKEEAHCIADERGHDVHSDTILLEDSALQKSSQISYDSARDSKLVRLDISFKSPSHTGLQTTELVIFPRLKSFEFSFCIFFHLFRFFSW